MGAFDRYKKFVKTHFTMDEECEELREKMIEFITKYREVLEDNELGHWACDERAMLEVLFDNREKLCMARRVPEYWEKEEEWE